MNAALDLRPDPLERTYRESSRAFRLDCPAARDGRHMVSATALERLTERGGVATCMQCALVLRVPEKRRLDVALNLVDNARVWAGLPMLTELERHFLRKLLGAREPIVEAMFESSMTYMHGQAEPSPPDPEPVTPAEKIAQLVSENDAARECERRLPPNPRDDMDCDGEQGA